MTTTRKAKERLRLPRHREERTLYDLWNETFGALERAELYRWREQAKADPQYRATLLGIEELVRYASRGEGLLLTPLDQWPLWLSVNWAFQDAEGKQIAADYTHAIEALDDHLARVVDRLADQFVQMVHRVPADRLPPSVAKWRSLKRNQPGTWARWRWATMAERLNRYSAAKTPADPANDKMNERLRLLRGGKTPLSTIAPKYFRRMKKAKAC